MLAKQQSYGRPARQSKLCTTSIGPTFAFAAGAGYSLCGTRRKSQQFKSYAAADRRVQKAIQQSQLSHAAHSSRADGEADSDSTVRIGLRPFGFRVPPFRLCSRPSSSLVTDVNGKVGFLSHLSSRLVPRVVGTSMIKHTERVPV